MEGGGYIGPKSKDNSLVKWTEEDWVRNPARKAPTPASDIFRRMKRSIRIVAIAHGSPIGPIPFRLQLRHLTLFFWQPTRPFAKGAALARCKGAALRVLAPPARGGAPQKSC